MFEKALILRPGGEAVDLGVIAETAFFYGSVQLLLQRGSIVHLAKVIPSGDLISFFDRPEIKVTYLREGLRG
jgi:hypothetical protein